MRGVVTLLSFVLRRCVTLVAPSVVFLMTPLTPSFFVHTIQQNNDDHLKCPKTGAELDVIETEPLVDWMANNYKHFGFKLEFVTDRSREGT